MAWYSELARRILAPPRPLRGIHFLIPPSAIGLTPAGDKGMKSEYLRFSMGGGQAPALARPSVYNSARFARGEPARSFLYLVYLVRKCTRTLEKPAEVRERRKDSINSTGPSKLGIIVRLLPNSEG